MLKPILVTRVNALDLRCGLQQLTQRFNREIPQYHHVIIPEYGRVQVGFEVFYIAERKGTKKDVNLDAVGQQLLKDKMTFSFN